jgi:hypothetical protein
MDQVHSLDKFTSPFGGQEIELLSVDHEAGFTSFRLRIREGKRFTIFDLDKQSAARWGRTMVEWADAQPDLTEMK